MTEELLCARCGHGEGDLDDLGLCTAPGCKCVAFVDDMFDPDDDETDDDPKPLDFDR
jgi:hypothetical protein